MELNPLGIVAVLALSIYLETLHQVVIKFRLLVTDSIQINLVANFNQYFQNVTLFDTRRLRLLTLWLF